MCGGLFWIIEGGDGVPERGGGQESVSPMTAHMGCDNPIAAVKKEGWYHGKGLWWEAIDRRKPVQGEEDGGVHSASVLLDLRDLRMIQLGHPSPAR